MMGFITCMNDILIPAFEDIFDLTYVQAMLIQFCFFTAYAIMSIPMGYLVGKIGYKNGVISGFVLTAIGCLLFILLLAVILMQLFGCIVYFGFRCNTVASGG